VRYKNNDYSVPARYGHREVLAKGYLLVAGFSFS